VAGKRFLLIEDEPLVALLLSDMVEDIGHVVAHEAGTLEKALELAAAGDFDAAILDANLRGEEAYAVAELLTQIGKPFFFSSGYTQDQFPEPWNHHCVMNKPFDLEQLRACINGLFGDLPEVSALQILDESPDA
jgi:DNA-binding response OmpR family regulator